jgi:hypothetical protein
MRTCSIIHLALLSSMFGAIALIRTPSAQALPKFSIPEKSTSAVDLKLQPQSSRVGAVKPATEAIPTSQTAQAAPLETTPPPGSSAPPCPLGSPRVYSSGSLRSPNSVTPDGDNRSAGNQLGGAVCRRS